MIFHEEKTNLPLTKHTASFLQTQTQILLNPTNISQVVVGGFRLISSQEPQRRFLLYFLCSEKQKETSRLQFIITYL